MQNVSHLLRQWDPSHIEFGELEGSNGHILGSFFLKLA